MKKIKSVFIGVIGATILVASIGFFATLGLALIGMFSALAFVAILTATVTEFLEQRKNNSERIGSNHNWQSDLVGA